MKLSVARILHAGYLFECGGARIIFDPLFETPFSLNCFAYPDVKFVFERIEGSKFDAVFISHHHDDHFSLESLARLDRSTPIYFYCRHPELFAILREMGFGRVHGLRVDETVAVGPFAITTRLALDPEIDAVFEIHAGGWKVLNVVDAWIDPRALVSLAASAPWDLVLWPFQTMRELAVLAPTRAEPAVRSVPIEWLEQISLLHPRAVVPSSCQFRFESWSGMNNAYFPITYARFTADILARLPDTEVLRLNPGESLELQNGSIGRGERLAWIQPIGPQDVEYGGCESEAPPAAEIARRMPQLNSVQSERVREFIEFELADRFRRLAPSHEPWFGVPVVWRLSVFGSDGQASRHRFFLDQREISRIGGQEGRISWSTEIPAAALFSALEDGAGLNALYVRINSESFAPEIESRIGEADILEDPLIRCLYEGQVGSYQMAQLRRLKSRFRDDFLR